MRLCVQMDETHACACVCMRQCCIVCFLLSSFFCYFSFRLSFLQPPSSTTLIQSTQLHDTTLSSYSRETNCSAEIEMYKICAPRPPLPNRCKPSKQEAKTQLEKCMSIAPHIYLFKAEINNWKHAVQAKKDRLKKKNITKKEDKNMEAIPHSFSNSSSPFIPFPPPPKRTVPPSPAQSLES